MKKFATIAGSLALFAATVFPAIAAGNNCAQNTTGPLSVNQCNITNNSSVNVTNTNNATITNTVTATSRSGGNSASNNTLGGSITTGNATMNAAISNLANINTTTVTGGPSASGNNGTNNVTGPSSDNRVTITNNQVVGVANTNQAVVNNTVNATTDSGSNTANTNTGPASVRTGNAGLRLSVDNHINDSATGVSAGAGGTGGNGGANNTTGPFSIDYVTINNTNTATVTNPNTLSLANVLNAISRSGANTANTNTLGGDVTTGGATGNVGINNEGNISTTTVNMSMGGFSNLGSNGVTGPSSDNRSNMLNTLGIVVSNPNTSNVVNTDTDLSDSGSNSANNNTGAGGVAAGLSDLVKTIMSHLNDSLTLVTQ